MPALRALPPKQCALHSMRSEMSIAANADKPIFSVRRSGRAGCDLSFKSVSAPPNGEEVFLLFQNYNHLAPNGAKTSAYSPPTRRATGLPWLGHVRVVGLLF